MKAKTQESPVSQTPTGSDLPKLICKLYADPDSWSHKAILNVAGSGKFSNDRTIAQYDADIWKVGPVP